MLLFMAISTCMFAQEYVDVTTTYLKNADLAVNPQNADNGWTVVGKGKGTGNRWGNWSTGVIEAYSAWSDNDSQVSTESDQMSEYSILQEVTLPAGKYRLTSSAFYRYKNAGGETSYAYVVAGENKVLVKGLGTESGHGDIGSPAAAKTDCFDKGLYLNTLEFTLEEQTTLSLGIGGTHPIDQVSCCWLVIGKFNLSVQESLDGYLAQYQTLVMKALLLQPSLNTAMSSALQAVLVDPDELTTVDGCKTVISNLEAVIAKAEAIIPALTKVKADIATAEEIVTKSTADEANKTTFNEAIATAKTAIDAATEVAVVTAAADALEAARQTYVSWAYPTDGCVFDMTFLVVNADITNGTDGWTTESVVGTPDNQHWSGVTNKFIEPCDWSATGWTCGFKQTITVPAGIYTVKAAVRAESEVTSHLIANESTYKVEALGDKGGTIATDGTEWENVEAGLAAGKSFANGNTGRGWTYGVIENVVVKDGSLTIGGTATTTAQHKWCSFDDFKVYLTGAIAPAEPLEAIFNWTDSTTTMTGKDARVFTVEGVTLTTTLGTNTNNAPAINQAGEIRFYANNAMTIVAPAGMKIGRVFFYAGAYENGAGAEKLTYNGAAISDVWTLDTPAETVELNAAAKCSFKKIVVVCIAEGQTLPEYVPVSIANTLETAYTVAKAKELYAAGEDLSTKVYVKGIVTSVDPDGKFDASYGNINYFIADAAGDTENDIQVYRGYGLDSVKFAAADELMAGDEVVVYGQLSSYNNVMQIGQYSKIASIVKVPRPLVPAVGLVDPMRMNLGIDKGKSLTIEEARTIEYDDFTVVIGAKAADAAETVQDNMFKRSTADAYSIVMNSGTITFKAAKGKAIKKITIPSATATEAKVKANVGNYAAANRVGTWTGEATEVVLTFDGVNLTTMTVGDYVAPTIEVASVADIKKLYKDDLVKWNVNGAVVNGAAKSYDAWNDEDIIKTFIQDATGAIMVDGFGTFTSSTAITGAIYGKVAIDYDGNYTIKKSADSGNTEVTETKTDIAPVAVGTIGALTSEHTSQLVELKDVQIQWMADYAEGIISQGENTLKLYDYFGLTADGYKFPSIAEKLVGIVYGEEFYPVHQDSIVAGKLTFVDVKNIAEVKTLADGTNFKINLEGLKVTKNVPGRGWFSPATIIVEDASGAIELSVGETGLEFPEAITTQGNVVNGQLIGTYAYNMMMNLVAIQPNDSTVESTLTVDAEAKVEPTVMTIADAKKPENNKRYIKVENVDFVVDAESYATTISDGNETIDLYDTWNKMEYDTLYNMVIYDKYEYIIGIVNQESEQMMLQPNHAYIAQQAYSEVPQVITEKKWDFTQWSNATKELLKTEALNYDVETAKETNETTLWRSYEKQNGAEPDKGGAAYWYGEAIVAGATMTANGIAIPELKGLRFGAVTSGSLAIAIDYPEALSTYAGPSYLWIGGKNNTFTIPAVAPGSTVTMDVESHKATDGRGVSITVNGEKIAPASGSEKPTVKETVVWNIPATLTEAVDLVVTNNNGCHIYYIDIAPTQTVPDGIQNVNTTVDVLNGNVYSINGQKVRNAGESLKGLKGLYIINGNKVVIK